MRMCHWQDKPETLLNISPVMPVVVIEQLSHAIALAKALYEGGIQIIEVTLRTSVALKAIEAIRTAMPDMTVGAGTVLNRTQLQQSMDAGALFAISPGLTPRLLEAGIESAIPFIPGISSASELMLGQDYGYECFKFFPAEAMGGVDFLKAMLGPFPKIRFCPTGGIHQDNYAQYLALANVLCVGGSWMAPQAAIAHEDWGKITACCASALKIRPSSVSV